MDNQVEVVGISQPREDGVETDAVDKLHDVKVESILFADAEDRHDVRVMEPPGGARLSQEASPMRFIERRRVSPAP